MGYGNNSFDDENGTVAIPGKGWYSIKEAFNMLENGQISEQDVEEIEISVAGKGYFDLQKYVRRFGTSYPPEAGL